MPDKFYQTLMKNMGVHNVAMTFLKKFTPEDKESVNMCVAIMQKIYEFLI